MKYRIIMSIVLLLICLLSVAMHSDKQDTVVPTAPANNAPTFNL